VQLDCFNVPESTDAGWGIDSENFVTLCKSVMISQQKFYN